MILFDFQAGDVTAHLLPFEGADIVMIMKGFVIKCLKRYTYSLSASRGTTANFPASEENAR